MKGIKGHVAFWVFYFFIAYISDKILNPQATIEEELIFFTAQNIYLFYSILYALKKFNKKTSTTRAIGVGRFVLVISLFFCIRYFVFYYLLNNFFDKEYGNLPKIEWATVAVIWTINYFIFASAYFYSVSFIQKQKELNRVMQEKLAQEKDKLELENTLLKAQINPHFLYNSLNFLYAKSLPLSAELSNGIIKLSEIMRYSLQTHDHEGLVLLKDEVEHINNVLEMAQLRFSNKVFIDFSIQGNIDGLRVVPFAFITLVENVLKHGVINKSATPAKIMLQISETGILHFSTWNLKRVGPKELSTSIGLKNTLKRLESVYGNACKIDILDEKQSFSVKIAIDFKVTHNPH